MQSHFRGKVAVITGASSGIGRALALQMGGAGARLALSDIDAAGLAQTMALLPSGTEARAYKLDVSSREAVFAHADDVKRDFGAAHFVFNNAGTTMVGTFENLEIDEIEWQLGINLWGVIYGSKAFLPMMLAQREGCIVNISSIFGLIGFPTQSAYNISKFGVRGLTECLWRELEGTGVRALCVHPGGIKTNIERDGRRCRNAGQEEARLQALGAKLLVTPPETCANDILRAVRSGKKRLMTGNKSSTLFWLTRLMPNSYHSLVKLVA
ncbi:SDR family oxidoreductase [Variovorax sp. J22R115]|uniref:SDR family NAD(P)-dependent oxidoreductase n=1 Tax=Variovorax sp. J22R115 TaxID=3053509 RepID=UPI00257890C4|nr:SDR family oxidoreductase [Variovorax sp. J22R115]MDM0048851.1 SDR family oxidoreductase [Variovorax sp. J22R115]